MAMTIDPDELMAFRQKLMELADNLDVQLRRTDSAIESVAREWKDDQFMQDRDLLLPLRDEINDFQEGPLLYFQQNALEYENL
jgi:hypothetical protein